MQNEILSRTGLMVVIVSLVVACGGKSNDQDADAGDPLTEDVAADLEQDTVGDPQVDSPADTVADVATDTDPDTASDTTTDEPTDSVEDPDVATDPYTDWPTDNPADWTAETSTACEVLGGFCTEVRWELCPEGYEPVDTDPHSGCGSTGIEGWCCVVAPPSPCSASGAGNCIEGTTCTGCWASVALGCEEGRVCCQDICD